MYRPFLLSHSRDVRDSRARKSRSGAHEPIYSQSQKPRRPMYIKGSEQDTREIDATLSAQTQVRVYSWEGLWFPLTAHISGDGSWSIECLCSVSSSCVLPLYGLLLSKTWCWMLKDVISGPWRAPSCDLGIVLGLLLVVPYQWSSSRPVVWHFINTSAKRKRSRARDMKLWNESETVAGEN